MTTFGRKLCLVLSLGHLRGERRQVEIVAPGLDQPVLNFEGAHYWHADRLAARQVEVVDPFREHLVAVLGNADEFPVHRLQFQASMKFSTISALLMLVSRRLAQGIS